MEIIKKFADSEDEQSFVINIGPQHPSTHGVLHLKMRLNGETVIDVEPNLGYIHRGIEKMNESLTYKQCIHLTSRMDYLSAHMNNQAVSLAVEKAMQIEVPSRAQAIRIIMAELQRLASHQLWWGCLGLDMGAVTPFFLGFRERETILEIFEESTGNRLTMSYITPGGVLQDIHPNFVADVKKWLVQFKKNLPEFDQLYTGNIIVQSRLKGIGVLTQEDAINFGACGPVGRASGIACDVRKRFPYDGYDKLQFEEIIYKGGDCWDRYMVRMDEMKQSISIIEQLIDNIPSGSFREKLKGVPKVPEGEYYQRVETARGELGVYLVSDGGSKPYRLKYRTPNFSNLSALRSMFIGQKIGDMVAIMSTLDLIVPDIDR